MTLQTFDQETQKVIDDFDAYAEKRSADLLTPSDNTGNPHFDRAMHETRETAFRLGYKTGVVDLSRSWKTSELAVKGLTANYEALFEAVCMWRDERASIHDRETTAAEAPLIALIDFLRRCRGAKGGTP